MGKFFFLTKMEKLLKRLFYIIIEENAYKLYREKNFDLVLTKDFLTGLLNIKSKFLDILFRCWMDQPSENATWILI